MGIVARQSIKGSLANYLGIAIGFVTTFFVLTNYLTKEEIGLTRVMVDAATLFAAFAQLGTNSSIIKFFPYFKDGSRNRGIFGWSVLLPLIGFTVITLFLLFFRGTITDIYSERSPLIRDYFMLIIPLTFFMLYLTVFETNANVLMRITVPRIVREVGIRLFNLICYLLYGLGVVSLDMFVILFTLSYGIAMVLNLIYLVSLGHISFRIDFKAVDKRVIRDMVRYSLFMTIIVLATNSQLLGSLFIGAKEGLALTGVYTIAFFIANVVEVPYRSLGAISRPIVAEAAKNDNWVEVSAIARRVSLHQLLVSSFVLLLIWINLDALFAIIPNGEEYAGGKWVVLILGVAKIINSTLSISTDVLNYSKHYRFSLLFVLVLSGATIVFNSWLIGLWSINGAAFAILFAYLFYYCGQLFFIGNRLGVSLFSKCQLKVLVVVAAMLAIHLCWSKTIYPLLVANGAIWRLLIDASIKTIIVAAVGGLMTYKMKISIPINNLIDNFINRLKNKRQ